LSDLIEIRWHGRGGQGAKTAALLFADAAMEEGKFIQAFPEYGPERMGAPVQSFNRLSDKPITIHSGIDAPNIVVVLDATLVDKVDVTAGLPKDGKLVINTPQSPRQIRAQLGLCERKIYTVDASKIALSTLGRNIPNTPMLGALVKVSELLNFESMLENVRAKLQHKFASKPEIVEGNIEAIKRAYNEVREED
jgi:pyruvate ferredoxin oxidoreductase gamma subunit